MKAGYAVSTAEDGNAAMDLLERNVFDLVLIGRRSRIPGKPIDQRLREAYPDLLILKIAEVIEEMSPYPARITGSEPNNVLEVLKEMLGK